jgi:hypothetical protein
MIDILYSTDFVLDVDVVNTGSITDVLYKGVYGGQVFTVNTISIGLASNILFRQELLEYQVLQGGVGEVSYIF